MGGGALFHAVGGGVAAHRIGAVHLHQHVPDAGLSRPRQVGIVPARAGAFQDRAERARLRTAVPCHVLCGMGGVGKTQLAAEYAEEVRAAGGADLLVWISAGSRSAVLAGYAEAAADVCGADPGEPERAAARFLAWLGTERRRWLVVLDDLADPADLNGLWPPAVPHGRAVVTTRRRDAALTGAGRRRVDVGVFTPEEAAAYLRSALDAYGRTEPAGELAGLAEDLGHLPLALSQATAYVVDAGVSVRAYRDLLAGRAGTLAEVAPDVLPDGQTHTMAAAWSLSVDYADRLRPAGLARPMLHLASFLAPHGTPAEVLTSLPARAYLDAYRTSSDGAAPRASEDEAAPTAYVPPPGPATQPPRAPEPPSGPTESEPPRPTHSAPAPGPPPDAAVHSPVTPGEAAGALRALHRLSLLHSPGPGEGGEHPAVRAHQVVQRATRDALPAGWYATAARAAGDALVHVWPEVERDTAYAQTLRACAAALASYAGSTQALYLPAVHQVLFRAGESLGECGRPGAAVAHFEELSRRAATCLGPDHLDTLALRSGVANWRGLTGDVVGAAAANAELLDDAARTLGADDHNTLVTRENLAFWQAQAGHPEIAVALGDELLDGMVRVLGPDHPHTLGTRANLAHWKGLSGDAAGAAAALAALLGDRVRVLGPRHPDTFATRANTARWQALAGDPAGARGMLADLLAEMVPVLGADHPHTLVTRGLLAEQRGESGDPAGALAAYGELLRDLNRVLGPDHPNTLAARNRLATWQRESGDPAGALAAYGELLPDLNRVLGPDHPDTLGARNRLATWRGEAGDPAGAVTGYADLLADAVRLLGPDHRQTLAVRANLAFWHGRAGDPARAAALLAVLLPDMARLLGPDHHDVVSTRHHLAGWRALAADAN